MTEGPRRVFERQDFRDQRVHLHLPILQQAQGGLEAAAARADERDFVHDDRRGVDARQAVYGGFHDHGPARTASSQLLAAALAASQWRPPPNHISPQAACRLATMVVSTPAARAIFSFSLCRPYWWTSAPCALQVPGRSATRASRRPARRHDAPLGICDLIQNLAGRRQRLDENGLLGRKFQRGTRCRLLRGNVRNSRNAPGCFTIPSTVRRGQWRPRPRRAPFAFAACQIDLADHALADPIADRPPPPLRPRTHARACRENRNSRAAAPDRYCRCRRRATG